MTVFDRIKFLTKKRAKTMKQVTKDLGYSENYFYSLKSGKQPSAEKLNEMADYFNVSTDYLLGRTETVNSKELTVEEALKSVMSYDGQPVTENDREILKSIIEAYLDKK